jgi:hypothetical protein
MLLIIVLITQLAAAADAVIIKLAPEICKLIVGKLTDPKLAVAYSVWVEIEDPLHAVMIEPTLAHDADVKL